MPENEAPERKCSSIDFALPAVEYTDRQLNAIIEHDLTALETKALLYFFGNCLTDSGILHKRRISFLAKQFGCHPSRFYGENGIIARLNATGLVKLKMKHLKLTGKIVEPPKQRARDKSDHQYPLRVSMIHKECLKGLLPNTNSKAVIRTLMLLTFHCDLDTGDLNTELRASTIADMIWYGSNVCRTCH